ncbi:Bro-N domain-containing protein [Streptomyces sp. NPDC092369]|uniref:BRO-N domain-containing protein n=1 Tax=Streptomyces sp. NPDC092369 TaxID=3366015 RepID=UPI0038194F40
MYEQNDTPSEQSAARKQDAIDINDFVFASTGARVRRVTLSEGEYWFPAADVATRLGYANTRQALQWHVAADCQKTLDDLARSVYGVDASSKIAGHGLKKSMRMVNLRGLVALVNGCTKPECEPFKAWVCDVVVTIQRDGSYSLDQAPVQPAPDGNTAYLMPQQVADAIVRLEERNIRADEALAVAQVERIEQMRRTNEHLAHTNTHLAHTNEHLAQTNTHLARTNTHLANAAGQLTNVAELLAASHRVQTSMADALHRIAGTLDRVAERLQPPSGPTPGSSAMTPQELLAHWRAKNLVVTDDVHAVAACLAPALVRGAARCRLEEVAARTGLTVDRVQDCVRMLIKRGCIRQTGCEEDGVPVYALP